MQVKTFTALITIAVEDDKDMPSEVSLSDRIDLILQTKAVTCYEPVATSFSSVIDGDVIENPFISLKYKEHGQLMQLKPEGIRIQMVKDNHALLRDRAAGNAPIPHPTLNEGSDID